MCAWSIAINLNFSDLDSQFLWWQILANDDQLAVFRDIIKIVDVSMIAKSIHAIVNFPTLRQPIGTDLEQLHHRHLLKLLLHLIRG